MLSLVVDSSANLTRAEAARLGVTMVLITHSMAVARKACNRIAVISRGKIVELGDTEDVFTNPQSEAAKAIIAHHAGQETESEKGEVI